MWKKRKNKEKVEELYLASEWKLMWWRFKKNKLAIIGLIILGILYVLGIFCEFFSPYDPNRIFARYVYAPPQRIHFFHEGKFIGPFVYGYKMERDPETFRRIYKEDRTKIYRIKFFVHGDKYKLWNVWESNIHFFGVEDGVVFLFGTDRLGRDVFSRILYGARISTTIGLVGVFISMVLGIVIGGISGYYGGKVDNFIQRVIEFIISIPTIPLWMALAAALPRYWSQIKVYFAITVILSLIGWTGLARVVRSKFLSLKEEDFVVAARLAGASEWRIIFKHMLPSLTSHLIASATLAVPGMILGETGLSFLGLGLRPPAISWGVLLQEAQNIRTVALYPWLLIPGLFVIVTVLCFNFVGDGLRDAADPYKT
ncbi:Binding-protein-dependent transport systems inner membrane component [Thermotoga neapolitana LA10]|uniref:ABC transporter permease n=1 Tax=Thermotoga sp. RQ7 TaxID=126738 RepID=UPI0003004211|nr:MULTISPECIES: ABC transporter permease [Thermotoga]AJG40748.1 peptide ABC transporter permease [Thermotoga sp. RQ7]KFZ22067.1 Binding-protein-dependent transport systems inner membrane component [Thermotoga neapolitana LA10]MDK2786337.1 peptide/nickel transport system permease protein [Thermotoga sp.]